MKTIGVPLTIERMLSGTCWQLCASVNGFADSTSDELVTQAVAGRSFQLIDDFSQKSCQADQFSRLQVRLLEDGYLCWVDFSEGINRAFNRGPGQPYLCTKDQIQEKIPSVLTWLEKAESQENQYLWGGTIGPNFDCSGLVQMAFASQEIWLPRDAYQQERFCETIEISRSNYQMLQPGDLLFFGSPEKCTHVGIYIGDGKYCHSSGILNGRNGIGCDYLQAGFDNAIASHYFSQLRGAGRIVTCHNGMTLP